MANETNNSGNQGGAAGTEGKTYTQAELDSLLGQERAKYADYEDLKVKAEKYDANEAANQTELQKAQNTAADYKNKYEKLQKESSARAARDKVAAETGVPANLLTGDTEEACTAQAAALIAYKGGVKKYPNVKDGGETTSTGGGSTRDQFSDWFNENFK